MTSGVASTLRFHDSVTLDWGLTVFSQLFVSDEEGMPGLEHTVVPATYA